MDTIGLHDDLAIVTRGLTKRFRSGRVAVSGVDLDVPRGCVYGLLGPNGAGKTTLMRMILGLASPTRGSVALLGHELPRHRTAAFRHVGAMVEEPRFHPNLSGRQNLELIAAARALDDVERRIDEALEAVVLIERGFDPVRSYSLGMRQRLGLARCMLCDPRLLVLDEPTNGLDPAGILEIRRLVRRFADSGGTVLISSHLLDELEKVVDHLVILASGRTLWHGTMPALREELRRDAIRVGCDDPSSARDLLLAHASVAEVAPGRHGALDVSLSPTDGLPLNGSRTAIACELTRLLVDASIGVYDVRMHEASLEELFLEVVTTQGGGAR